MYTSRSLKKLKKRNLNSNIFLLIFIILCVQKLFILNEFVPRFFFFFLIYRLMEIRTFSFMCIFDVVLRSRSWKASWQEPPEHSSFTPFTFFSHVFIQLIRLVSYLITFKEK